MKINNRKGEKLDTNIEGADLGSAKKIVILAHGFGTDKHERGAYDAISEKLLKDSDGITIVRFSYSGFGDSEGDQKTKTLETMAEDLVDVASFVMQKNPRAEMIMGGYSLGNHILCKYLAENELKPNKVILVNLPECAFKERMQKFFLDRGLVEVQDDGVWKMDRADGSTSYIGPEFWESVSHAEKQRANLKKICESFPVYLFRATDDHVVDWQASEEEIKDLPFKEKIYLRGDHNYSKAKDMQAFTKAFVKVVEA